MKLEDAMMYATTPHMFGVDTQTENVNVAMRNSTYLRRLHMKTRLLGGY